MEIIGHERIRKTLERALEKDRVAHASLFCGPEAVGKFALASWLAGRLSRLEGESSDSNVTVITPEIEEKKGVKKEKDIKLESVRELKNTLGLTAFGEGNKVVIIRSAQKMNIAAQNALLKILEEPPLRSNIILVAEDERKLLPTVISRCEMKRFHLLSDIELEKIIPADILDRDELIFWACGRPGWAKVLMADPAALQEKRELLRELRNLFSADLNERFSQAESLTKDIPVLLSKMSFWLLILRNEFISSKHDVQISSMKAFELTGLIAESRRLMQETNANARLVLENLFIHF